jgi:ribosomal protein S27E
VDEDALVVWQDVLDQIMAGRSADLSCPHCKHRPMTVEEMGEGSTRISCSKCGKFIQGRFQPD